MRRGFTVVELLIVIVVIGILATLTIIAYSNVQNNARLATVRSDLEQSFKALDTFKLRSSNQQYPASQAIAEASAGLKVSAGNTVTYSPITLASVVKGYCATITNAALGRDYFVTSANNTPTPGNCSGMIGWWPFNNNVEDLSGYGAVSTNNGATLATGQNGQANGAFSFSGSTWIDATSQAQTFNSFSTTAWFQTTTTGDRKIVSLGSNWNPIQVFSADNYRTCILSCTAGGSGATNGSWHFVVVTGDATNVNTYVDGAATPVISTAASASSSNGAIRFGRDISTGSFYYAGLIDDVRLYSRALSVSEMQALYSAGAQ